MKIKLFEYQYTKGNIDYYTPNENLDLYIRAIDVETGEIALKRILEYTIHKDLVMYKISDPEKKRFKDFWVSDDHSLVVYDEDKDCIVKISPKEVNSNKRRYSLIKCIQNGQYYYDLIPTLELNITLDTNVTEGADFTVEDYYTFATDDGIFVQDTMAIFHPISAEAQQDIKEKMIKPHYAKSYTSSVKELSKDAVIGIYVLTK